MSKSKSGGQAPTTESKPRRSFTGEFKKEAVRLAIERGNVSAVARDLGIGESMLAPLCASGDFQGRLESAGISCSMSRRGNCWDNAPVESYFGTLKQELVHRCDFVTRAAARSKIFEWLEVWYNRHRRHSSLGYISPVEFERQATLSSALLNW